VLLTYPGLVAAPSEGAGTRALLFLVLSALAGVLVAGVALPAIGLVGLTAKRGAESFQALPAELKVPPLKQRSRLLAADGTVIATFYSQNRIYVPMDKIAPVMQNAIVAIEDARFYDHNGIDVRGTIRAMIANTQAGEVTQGGSTITQQYVKNVLEATAKTKEEHQAVTEDSFARKIQELRYALGLEQRWSKRKILEGYLNIAYFGSQAYGIEVAAHRYFSVSADDLNPGQAATLAGIVRYPSLYDPIDNPKESQARRNFVLQRMADENMITQRVADKYGKQPIKKTLDPSDLTRGCAVSKVPFFCTYVQQSFLSDPAYGQTRAERRRLLNGGGLTITTTLQMDDQTAAQRGIETYLPTGDPSGRVAAIAMIQPGTGDVTAMAQNLKYGKGKGASYINNAVDLKYQGTAGQQPGSTFKIFTVAAAIEKGLSMTEHIYAPDSRVMPYGSYQNCDGNVVSGGWDVQNYDGAPSGDFDMFQGTAYSVNTYFAELARRTGLCNIWDMASRAGVTAAGPGTGYEAGEAPIDDVDMQYAPGIIGGTFGMSPLTMAESYATFAARGLHCEPRVITSVRTLDKQQLDVPPPQCEQVVEPKVADAVNYVLQNVVRGDRITNGTGAPMYLGRPTAGKTGTSDNHEAIGFAGYTPNLAAVVWCGSPTAPKKYPMENVTINGVTYATVSGYQLPGPIWKAAMLGSLADMPVKNFVPMDPEFLDGAKLSLPSVAGLSAAEATKKLEGLRLNVSVSDTQVSSYQAKGTVAYTSPGPGTTLAPGATVTLYLSSGVAPSPTSSPSTSGGDTGSGNGGGSNGGGTDAGGGNGGDNGNGNGAGGGAAGGPGNSDGNPGGGNTNNN